MYHGTFMTSPALIPGVILIPLSMAALFFFVRRPVPGLLVSVPALGIPLCSSGIALQVLKDGPLHYAVGGWREPLGIALYADGLSAALLLMTAVVGSCISVYSLGYFRKNIHSGQGELFWPLWMFLWAALNALYLSADIFNIYVTLELLGLSGVALITLSGDKAALTGGMRYLLIAVLGSLSYLLGVALLYNAHSTLSMPMLSRLASAGIPTHAALALMTVGLLLKTALFPLHFWLPPAHASAPSPVSALLSGLVVKASFYLLARLWTVFSSALLSGAAPFLGALGAAAILWGSFFALRQKSLKMLIAYSTVAQLGYLFLLFPLSLPGAGAGYPVREAWNGSLYHLLSHAFAKAAMFMAAGNIIHALGHDRLDGMSGIGHRLPVTFFALGLSGISIMGLPPSGGFAAKWLLLIASLKSGQWWWAVFIIAGSLMAAGYVFLIYRHAFEQNQTEDQVYPVHPVPGSMELSTLSLAVLSLLLGITAEPVLKLVTSATP